MADSAKLQRLIARKERLQARLKQLEAQQGRRDARASVRARKRETRELILLGRLTKTMMAKSPRFAARIRRALDEWLTRPHDREIFHLDEQPSKRKGAP